jgi:aldehyde:ferredoxin oxidoreductase
MGTALGVAMDGGLLEFGDALGALELLESGATGEGKGRLLWDGTLAIGTDLGVEHIPVVKGQSLPAYDPRSVMGIGVTYATTPQGADHTAGYTITANILKVGGSVDPLSPEGQMVLSRNLQIATAMLDSLGFCIFVAFPVLDITEAFAAIHEMMEAHTGEKWDSADLMQLGREVLTMERMYNQYAGFSSVDDRLPAWFRSDALPPHGITFQVTDAELDEVFNFVPDTAAEMGLQ